MLRAHLCFFDFHSEPQVLSFFSLALDTVSSRRLIPTSKKALFADFAAFLPSVMYFKTVAPTERTLFPAHHGRLYCSKKDSTPITLLS